MESNPNMCPFYYPYNVYNKVKRQKIELDFIFLSLIIERVFD